MTTWPLAGDNMVHELINPAGIGEVDVAVFIPSLNEAENIALTVKKASMGLARDYPSLRSVIVNCDNHSSDGTKDAFFQAECEVPRIYISTPPDVSGKGANIENAFKAAEALSAKVVVLLDANLISIKSGWIKSLVDPILTTCAEYVAPLYIRNRYDSPITKGLAYPLGRALFARRVLQPLDVDHAFSGKVNSLFFKTMKPSSDARGYSADLYMLSTAVVHNVPICQSFMAHPRITTRSGNASVKLDVSFKEVTSVMFDLLIDMHDLWKTNGRSKPTALAGGNLNPVNQAPQVNVDLDFLASGYLTIGRRSQEIWNRFFTRQVAEDLAIALAEADRGMLDFPVDLWRRAVFDAVLAYRKAGAKDREAIVSSLYPLFLARGYTSYHRFQGLTEREVTSLLEEEAMVFEAHKNELVERW